MIFVDTPTARILPARTKPIRSAIVHTTGDTELAKILAWYTSADGYQPHYFIDYDGTKHRIVPEDHIAWHCKIEDAEARLYQQGYAEWCRWIWQDDRPVQLASEFAGYRQWRDEWGAKGLHSPLELVTNAYPNSYSVGIELRQPVQPGPIIFTDDQYSSLAELLGDISCRNQFPADRSHFLGHSDCSPMRRCNPSGPWDPGRDFSWMRVWDLLGQ